MVTIFNKAEKELVNPENPQYVALGIWIKTDYEHRLNQLYPDAEPLTDDEIAHIVYDLEEAMNGEVVFPTLDWALEQIVSGREKNNG